MSRQRPARLLAAIAVLGLTAIVVVGVIAVGRPADPLPPATGPDLPDEVSVPVLRVIDGDTITISLDGRTERVRYIGIDAPELARAAGGLEAGCWADEALAENADLVEDEMVILERDTSDRDRFGRLLRHAWVAHDGEWLLVGEALVERGAAEARSYPPDTAHDRRLQAAEQLARDAGAGMWGAC